MTLWIVAPVRLCHVHAHLHLDTGGRAGDIHRHEHPRRFPLRALMVGMIHGMAGSASLIILTLKTLSSPLEGDLYILFFGAGCITGMVSLTVVVALPLGATAGLLSLGLMA